MQLQTLAPVLACTCDQADLLCLHARQAGALAHVAGSATPTLLQHGSRQPHDLPFAPMYDHVPGQACSAVSDVADSEMSTDTLSRAGRRAEWMTGSASR